MRATIASVLAAASLTVFMAAPRAQAPAFDLVIRNGRIVDGTGSPWYLGDLAVRNDIIVRIAPRIDAPATRVIDAGGKVVAPASSISTPTPAAASSRCRPPTTTCDRV